MNTHEHSSTSESLLNKREAASLLGVSQRTVDNWISSKQLPYVKLSYVVRFIPADIHRFITERRINNIGSTLRSQMEVL
jgi:excisionase family DNA binding protein